MILQVMVAEQVGRLLMIPFVALYILGEINIVPLVIDVLLIISAVVLVVNEILFFISRPTFQKGRDTDQVEMKVID